MSLSHEESIHFRRTMKNKKIFYPTIRPGSAFKARSLRRLLPSSHLYLLLTRKILACPPSLIISWSESF